MNLHMPQDPESEAELRNLAAIPYQIISPGNNTPIIGIFQDSMLGSYQFTRENIVFTKRDAMNLLMMCNRINENAILEKEGPITSFDIMSQIIPPLSLYYKTKLFKEGDDVKTSNGILEIKNGEYIRGQIDKGVVGSGTKGLIHRICNDFGNIASAQFIDDLQNVVTSYLKTAGFSVGISDLIINDKTKTDIITTITNKKIEVKNLLDRILLGVFDNNTGKSNVEEFETEVDNIMKKAFSDSEKIIKKKLTKDNRFSTMVAAGSKGSDLNISFMISCLGQQNVDGKRIPYGFENRTLPHYTKFDDSPVARGFVENCYINGLSPQELFFHAMGGRVGLIDTAVKTSTTGYIQRRLIKGLEDLMVNYDMTIRTNKGKIVQFQYGEDGIDTTKVENQILPLVNMSIQEIYAHYNLLEEAPGKTKTISTIFLKNTLARHKKQATELMAYGQKYTDLMIDMRKQIVDNNVLKKKDEIVVNSPVAFQYIIQNVQGQLGITSSSLVDITIVEAYQLVEQCYEKLDNLYYSKPTLLFKTLFFFYLSPKELLVVKRLNKAALVILLEKVITDYKKAIVAPGEMVGLIAGQSIGEISTQMSLLSTENVKIVCKNKTNGSVEMKSVKIGEFIDDIMNILPKDFTKDIPDHKDSTETLLENDVLENDYFIVGVSETERTAWNKISHVSRHPVNGDMIRIKTRSGREVETTTSHSHLVRSEKEQKVLPIRGSDMCIGMRIPVAKHIDNTYVQDTIKLNTTSENIKLDYLFGWFIGAYLAEGNINYHEILITNISEEFIEKTRLVAERFGKETRVSQKEGEYGQSVTTKFVCKELSKLLLNTCGTGSFVKKVPDFAFTAPNEFKSGLIQAYFDGDGNFQSNEKHHQIRACSRSQQLIKDMALLLNYFDIFASIKENMAKGSKIYNLNISSKFCITYSQKIGTLLHNEKLKDMISYINRINICMKPDVIDKIPGLGEIVARCGKTLELPGQSRTYRHYKNKESIGRRTLEKYYETFKSHPNAAMITEELGIIKQAIEADVVWDEIVSIEKYTPDNKVFVYDFTVPGNQTFMTDYGVIVHNTLNTFHFAGVASKSNVTRGVPRIEEILSLSPEPKNQSLTVFLREEDEQNKDRAMSLMYMLEHTRLEEIVKAVKICFDPDDLNTLIQEDRALMEQYKAFESMVEECATSVSVPTEEGAQPQPQPQDNMNKSNWVIRLEMDPETMLEKNITMDDVHFTLNTSYDNQISCVYSDYNADNLVFRIRLQQVVKEQKASAKKKAKPLDQTDEIYVLKNFQENLLQNVILRGVKGINKVILRKIKDNMVEKNGVYSKQDIWVLDTVGTNLLDVLALDYVDSKRTFSNNIMEVFNVLGIEAARNSIYNELVDVVEFDGTYVNYHNYSVLVDRMTFNSRMISIFRHGINSDDIGPIAKASFEETPEMFLKAARHGELDNMKGISANVMCGQEGFFGTSAFQVFLDLKEMQKLSIESEYVEKNIQSEIDAEFGFDETGDNDTCSKTNLSIQNNVLNIKKEEVGIEESEGYSMF